MLENCDRRKFQGKLQFLLLMFLLPYCLSACQRSRYDLPFTSIDQAQWGYAGSAYDLREPGLWIIAKYPEIVDIDDWISLDAQTYLTSMDYENRLAIVVFQGIKPTSGYKVQITQIKRDDNVVNVYAQFQERNLDDEATNEMNSPYHVVEVDKIGLWSHEMVFNLIVDKNVISSRTHFIP